MSAKKKLPGRSPPFRPVAIVDIGSNSVRLVVYDGLRRAPVPIFNEKILCGLGRGLALTGELPAQAVERAIGALKRFGALCRHMGIEKIFAVATAAARDASNGAAFIEDAAVALGAGIKVLSGKQEARYAALGVVSGIANADGVVGDLGGGSLELVDVRNGRIRDGLTLPLGALRLLDMSAGSISEAARLIEKRLGKAKLLAGLRGRAFYAVGGTWRNLARLHMAQSKYPLNILHHYRMSHDAARSVSALVSGLSSATLADISAVSRNRAETLPYGALVLDRLLARAPSSDVVFSVLGLREGYMYAQLGKNKRDRDPLLSACWDFARRYARSPKHELELCDWSDDLFRAARFAETEDERRLRHAACLLADIGWRANPDYRGGRSLNIISQASFIGIDHAQRMFLALCVFYRYQGVQSNKVPADLARLLDDASIERCRQIAAVFRLAYVLSAAMPGTLPQTSLRLGAGKVVCLTISKKLRDLAGETVTKRLGQLADLIGHHAELKIK